MNHTSRRWKRPVKSPARLPCQRRVVPHRAWSFHSIKAHFVEWSNTTRACVIWGTPELSNTSSVFNRPALISLPLHNTLSSLKITTLAVLKCFTTWPPRWFLSLLPFPLFMSMFFSFGVRFFDDDDVVYFFFFFPRVKTIVKCFTFGSAAITASQHAAFTSPVET